MVGDVREMSVIETAPSPVLTAFTIPWERQSCPQKMAAQSGQGWDGGVWRVMGARGRLLTAGGFRREGFLEEEMFELCREGPQQIIGANKAERKKVSRQRAVYGRLKV